MPEALEYRTLAGLPVPEILNVFNEAFSDYIVPLQLSENQFLQKIKAENIKPELSVGAFVNKKLVGLILTGVSEKGPLRKAYNAGTGVIPSFRGQQITQQLYIFLVPLLKDQGIREHQLEVLQNNTAALAIYKKAGFTITRSLSCYKGSIVSNLSPEKEQLQFKEITVTACETMQKGWLQTPAWQNSTEAIKRNLENVKLLGAFSENKLIGFAAIVPASGKIHQLYIESTFRNQGFGTAFLFYINKHIAPLITILNADDHDKVTTSFLIRRGFCRFVMQYEMTATF